MPTLNIVLDQKSDSYVDIELSNFDLSLPVLEEDQSYELIAQFKKSYSSPVKYSMGAAMTLTEEETSATLSNPGSGYSTILGVSTAGGSGTGLKVNVTASGGLVTAIVVSESGEGYTIGDIVTISGGDQNATITVSDVILPIATVTLFLTSTFSRKQYGLLSGTVTIVTDDVDINPALVTGTGTLFRRELETGDYISVNNIEKLIYKIDDNTHLTVDSEFSSNSTDASVFRVDALAGGRYYYDVVIKDSDDLPVRLFEGTLTLTPGISEF